MRIPFFDRLRDARRVLIAGCGGGFDVLSGIPLYEHLKGEGREVVLANLSFSRLGMACRERLGPSGWLVDQGCPQMDYFPERHLVDWLAERGHEPLVIGFSRTGVQPLAESYREAIRRFGIDAVVLVDGGTDSVIRGDEALLGTPEEDALSVVALDQVECARKFLACLGFGIDHYHGICHHSFLENTAELARGGGFLGAASVCAGTPEGDAFLSAVDHVNARGGQSIVANSIASSLRGDFGDRHATTRTKDSKLFINALMSLLWCYDLGSVARLMGFRDSLVGTRTLGEVEDVIRQHHVRAAKREWVSLPL